MRFYTILLLAMCFLAACSENKYDKKVHLPSHIYHYVIADIAALPVKQKLYVPVYSNIYMLNGTRQVNLTATLSVRQMNFTDSIYITKVDYYNSQGKLLKRYLDSTVLLSPMHSVEFVVEEKESEGGAGANFIVEWAATHAVQPPLVQAVMLTSYNAMGISFLTEGHVISDTAPGN